MIKFSKRQKKVDEKQLILVQILQSSQAIQRELTAMRGDSKSKEFSIQEDVAKMSEELAKLTKMIYDMVESLSKYFKLEVEFMEKEKEKSAKKPSPHDAIF
ncbi:unnamed protein product [marine sediment metagenome]|uniref:Uncharacterized protein n=1 Tax=marine sediment metagenome TaxID=412755 RepID=X0UF24_9ZZZZ